MTETYYICSGFIKYGRLGMCEATNGEPKCKHSLPHAERNCTIEGRCHRLENSGIRYRVICMPYDVTLKTSFVREL